MANAFGFNPGDGTKVSECISSNKGGFAKKFIAAELKIQHLLLNLLQKPFSYGYTNTISCLMEADNENFEVIQELQQRTVHWFTPFLHVSHRGRYATHTTANFLKGGLKIINLESVRMITKNMAHPNQTLFLNPIRFLNITAH